jgi:formyltetrahydrofolate deformylase
LVLTVAAPDGPGLIGAIASAVAMAGGNVVDMRQATDPYLDLFGCRVAIDGPLDPAALAADLDHFGQAMGMRWELHDDERLPRVVIACSTTLHCISDLLARIAIGDLRCELVGIVSDKEDAAELAARFEVPYLHVPVGEDRAAQEQAFGEAVDSLEPDLVVLARYMRILPGWLVEQWAGRMINIHHSTLPAFPGANPRARAHQRGVKLIGATAHYVTAELDEGPIISQDVAHVERESVAELTRIGADVERAVLADAIRLHLDHRLMVFGNRTCVFR